jgi:hypothetical protein
MGNNTNLQNQGKSYDADWEVLDPREQDYRDALGDGFEILLGDGADTLAALVEGLNGRNIHGPKGQRWTEELLESELERIAH